MTRDRMRAKALLYGSKYGLSGDWGLWVSRGELQFTSKSDPEKEFDYNIVRRSDERNIVDELL